MWEMKRNVSVVRFKFRYNILISGKIIKEIPGSVAIGTRCRTYTRTQRDDSRRKEMKLKFSNSSTVPKAKFMYCIPSIASEIKTVCGILT